MADVKVKIGVDGSGLKTGLNRAKSDVDSFANDTSRKIEGWAKGFGAALSVGAIVEFTKSIVQAGAKYESLAKSFDVFTGSAEAGKKVMEDITKFAASTPFELTEVGDASKKLLAFNISAADLIPTLKAVGDVSAAIGAPISEIAEIYGKAKVQGRLFAEDINQLTGRGIPVIQELAKQFGVTDDKVKDLVKNGDIGFENLRRAFEDLTADGGKFNNMMQAQSQTTGGRLSNLQDAVDGLKRSLFGLIEKPFNIAVNLVTNQANEDAENIRRGIIPKMVRNFGGAAGQIGGVISDFMAKPKGESSEQQGPPMPIKEKYNWKPMYSKAEEEANQKAKKEGEKRQKEQAEALKKFDEMLVKETDERAKKELEIERACLLEQMEAEKKSAEDRKRIAEQLTEEKAKLAEAEVEAAKDAADKKAKADKDAAEKAASDREDKIDNKLKTADQRREEKREAAKRGRAGRAMDKAAEEAEKTNKKNAPQLPGDRIKKDAAPVDKKNDTATGNKHLEEIKQTIKNLEQKLATA